MHCIGITGKYKRCKNDCKFIYCNSHRFQWWTIIGIIGTLLGLYEGIAYFFEENNSNIELIEVVQNRKNEIDTIYSDITKLAKIIERDTTINIKVKERLSKDLVKIKGAKREFDTLIKKSVVALKEKQPIAAHDIFTQIHEIPNKYQLTMNLDSLMAKDTFYQEFIKKYQIKNIELKKNKFLEKIDLINNEPSQIIKDFENQFKPEKENFY